MRFQQLCLSFSQPIFSRSKFDPSVARFVNNNNFTANTGCLQVFKNKGGWGYCSGHVITIEFEGKSLKQTRQTRDLMTVPLEDFDLDVLEKTACLATGEAACDLIHLHTRIPK